MYVCICSTYLDGSIERVEDVAQADDGLADVVHVKDRRVRVETRCVELVRILHGYLSECLEVAAKVGCLELFKALQR